MRQNRESGRRLTDPQRDVFGVDAEPVRVGHANRGRGRQAVVSGPRLDRRDHHLDHSRGQAAESPVRLGRHNPLIRGHRDRITHFARELSRPGRDCHAPKVPSFSRPQAQRIGRDAQSGQTGRDIADLDQQFGFGKQHLTGDGAQLGRDASLSRPHRPDHGSVLRAVHAGHVSRRVELQRRVGRDVAAHGSVGQDFHDSHPDPGRIGVQSDRVGNETQGTDASRRHAHDGLARHFRHNPSLVVYRASGPVHNAGRPVD